MPRTGKRFQRHYDHRLRELVFRTGDVLDRSSVELRAEIVKLRRRVETLRVVVRLLVLLQRIADNGIERTRISDPASRAKLLRAAERAERTLPRRTVLKILGISPARYAGWKRRERGCEAPEQEGCVRTTPTRLTVEEISAIRRMATDERYRHVPTSRLSVLAERLGTVFAAPTTWYRLVREREWSRPRQRRHPKPPKTESNVAARRIPDA